MGGWGSATRQRGWNQGGWSQGGWTQVRRDDVRRDDVGRDTASRPSKAGRWTALDIGLTVGAFLLSHELALAFVALKLWHQASGYDGSVLAFAGDRWEALVRATRRITSGSGVSMPFASRSSGNHAFDAWRQTELARIEAERNKLRASEREFAAYRDELLHAKDREDFDRFMQARADGRA